MRIFVGITVIAASLVTVSAVGADKPEPPPVTLQVWGPDLQPPKLISKVSPETPDLPEAQTHVVVNLWIDETGSVARVDHLAGPARLSGAALEAAKQWKFEPARVAGVPVRAVQSFVVQFKVKKRPETN